MTHPLGINDPREALLDVQLVDGKLVMSIGIDFLCRLTVNELNDHGGYSDSQVKLKNTTFFADAIVGELLCEDDDGSTLVHRMLVKAAEHAVENGCDGIEVVWDEEVDA